MEISPDYLFKKIGEQTVQIDLLIKQLQETQEKLQELEKLKKDEDKKDV